MYPMFKLIVFELKFSFAIVCLHITWTFILMGRNRVVKKNDINKVHKASYHLQYDTNCSQDDIMMIKF